MTTNALPSASRTGTKGWIYVPSDESLGYFHIVRFADERQHHPLIALPRYLNIHAL